MKNKLHHCLILLLLVVFALLAIFGLPLSLKLVTLWASYGFQWVYPIALVLFLLAPWYVAYQCINLTRIFYSGEIADSRLLRKHLYLSVTVYFAMCLLILSNLFPMVDSSRDSTLSPNLILKRGTYPSPDGEYHLVIGTKSKTLVDYKIVHLETKEEYAPEELFSDIMRWAGCWDGSDTLWMYSSDMGLWVWRRSPDGAFSRESLTPTNRELAAEIPQELWDYLPSGSMKAFAKYRTSQ